MLVFRDVCMKYLEPQTTIYKWMFGETTMFYIKIWNHPIETTIYKWLFGVPGIYIAFCVHSSLACKSDRLNNTSWGMTSFKIQLEFSVYIKQFGLYINTRYTRYTRYSIFSVCIFLSWFRRIFINPRYPKHSPERVWVHNKKKPIKNTLPPAANFITTPGWSLPKWWVMVFGNHPPCPWNHSGLGPLPRIHFGLLPIIAWRVNYYTPPENRFFRPLWSELMKKPIGNSFKAGDIRSRQISKKG